MAENTPESAPEQLRDPVMVAVWAGMGGVALNAGAYLVEQLDVTLVGEFPPQELFDLQAVEVASGLMKPVRLPRSMIFEWRNPRGKHDVLLFVGEAQPSRGGYGLCQKLIEYATQRGVRRLYTFAAMATQLHPSTPPRVFGVATDEGALVRLREQDVEILKDGQISGLNGVLLAVAAERGVPGICLLGELPFFGVGIANPKASLAVLRVFCSMVSLDLDLAELSRKADQSEPILLQLLEQLKAAARQRESGGEDEDDEEGSFALPEFAAPEPEADDAPEPPAIDEPTRRKIESLFRTAAEDRSRAVDLKELLDRHGVFGRYEDRFLDLFRKGE